MYTGFNFSRLTNIYFCPFEKYIINALKKTAQLVPYTILSNILFIVTLESLRIDLNIYKPD